MLWLGWCGRGRGCWGWDGVVGEEGFGVGRVGEGMGGKKNVSMTCRMVSRMA